MLKEGKISNPVLACLAQPTCFEVGAAMLVSSVNYDP